MVEHRPFVGKSGQELMRALQSIGVSRRSVSITNAVLCAPPGAASGALERFNHALQKENKKRVRAGLEKTPTPQECCAPRLAREVAALPKVIALGGTAAKAVIGEVGSIIKIRGGPREIALELGDITGAPLVPGSPTVKVLPTLHPSFVMRARRWAGAFRADLARAFRWFSTGLDWKEPNVEYQPSPMALKEWLLRARELPYTVYDVETEPGFVVGAGEKTQKHYDPLFDRLRCIGLGGADGRAIVIPFKSIEFADHQFYSPADWAEIITILRSYFTSPNFVKAGWNSGYYDRIVIERRLGVTPAPHYDGLLLHRVAEPELPHGLGYAGSVHTDVHAWKQGHTATTTQSDQELWQYNAVDTVVTAQVIPRLVEAVAQREQQKLPKIFTRVQEMCVGLHYNGMFVDQARREWWDKKLLVEAKEQLKTIRGLVGDSNFNPGSSLQLRELLFEKWAIPPYVYTELGDPSTNDDSLRAFLSSTWGLTEDRRKAVQALRDYRKRIKLRGTYITRLRPIGNVAYAEPLLAVDEAEPESIQQMKQDRKGKAPLALGLVLPDGRVHPDYLPHGTDGWRISSSRPNAQNFPTKIRDLIIPQPGHALVGCDQAQLELRVAAGLAGAAHYLEEFHNGGDPHHALCLDVHGDAYKHANPDQKKALRRFVKEATYLSLYRGGVETLHESLTSAEDENGRLLYPDLSVRECGAFHDKWLRRNPEFESWWERDLEFWRRNHFLADAVFGLKVDILDGEDPNKIANWRCQSTGAALMHLATFQLVEAIPFGKWGPGTGLINQCHDSNTVECPAEHPGPQVPAVLDSRGEVVKKAKWCADDNCQCTPAKTARLLEETMAIDGRQFGMDVSFLGEAMIGNTWKDT